jgi:hypothetical protein
MSTRDRVADARRRSSDLRERIAQARRERDTARAQLPDGQPDINSEPWRAAERAVANLQAAEHELGLVQDEERHLLGHLAGVGTALDRSSILHDPSVMAELGQLATSRAPIGSMQLGPLMGAEDLVVQIERDRMMAAGTITTPGEGPVRAPYFGAVQQQRRELTLLDLVPTVLMEMPIIPFLVETAMKHEADLTLEEKEAKAKTIAHWFKSSRQALADIGGLQTLLQDRLTYGVLRRVESQIVAGDGVGENLLGLLHTPLVGEVEHAAENTMDLVSNGIVTVKLLEGTPTGICLNPLDYYAARKAKASGSGEYLSGSPWMPTDSTLWDLPVVQNTAVPQGKAIVGDWARGMTLFVREGVNARLSDSDQDDFLRNRCTILGEGRFALATWKPRSFAVVALS